MSLWGYLSSPKWLYLNDMSLMSISLFGMGKV